MLQYSLTTICFSLQAVEDYNNKDFGVALPLQGASALNNEGMISVQLNMLMLI